MYEIHTQFVIRRRIETYINRGFFYLPTRLSDSEEISLQFKCYKCYIKYKKLNALMLHE